MADVVIYTTPLCPYCARAKRLLDHKGVVYAEVDLWTEPGRRAEMLERAGGRRTVPQIFIDGRGIGGSDDLHTLDAQGKLDGMLFATRPDGDPLGQRGGPMIRFGLVCAHGHEFEGWFRSGESFEWQAASGDLSCPACGDTAVQKAVMAPAVARSRTEVIPPDPRRAAMAQMLQMARKVQEHVEKNFDNVGERFPEEARKIHYGDTEHRDIYGKATNDEAQALRDEGIAIGQLPSLPKLDG